MKKRIIAMLLCCMTLIPLFAIGAGAVSVLPKIGKKYDAFTTQTFVAQTGKKNGTITFYSMKDTTLPGTKVPVMLLEVTNKTKKTVDYKWVTGNRSGGLFGQCSSKLSLEKGCTYSIKVSYLKDKSINWGTFGYDSATMGGKKTTWYPGNWWISDYKNVTFK